MTSIRSDLLGRYLAGDTYPTRANLERIASAVDVEIGELLLEVSQVPGKAVGQLRELNGWTQATLASSVDGLALRSLQRIEACEVPMTADEHKRLAAALAIDALTLPPPELP